MPEWTGTFAGAGLYPDLPEDLYHRDVVPEGSLSVTSARLLLPPSVPAKFKWAREHPHKSTAAMDLGTTVHGMALGTGAEVAVVQADSWRTKAAQNERDEAEGLGMVPMLAKDYAEAKAIADAMLAHPTAGALLEGVDPEVSMFAVDPEFGIWLRGRADAVTMAYSMPTVVDVKTTKDASPAGFAKSVADFGYHRQDPWYRQLWAAILGCDPDEIDFVFAVVETEPPYLVATYRVDAAAVDVGREQNRIAREVYADCTESGIWPGYSEEIEDLELPYYKRRQMEREISDWHE